MSDAPRRILEAGSDASPLARDLVTAGVGDAPPEGARDRARARLEGSLAHDGITTGVAALSSAAAARLVVPVLAPVAATHSDHGVLLGSMDAMRAPRRDRSVPMAIGAGGGVLMLGAVLGWALLHGTGTQPNTGLATAPTAETPAPMVATAPTATGPTPATPTAAAPTPVAPTAPAPVAMNGESGSAGTPVTAGGGGAMPSNAGNGAAGSAETGGSAAVVPPASGGSVAAAAPTSAAGTADERVPAAGSRRGARVTHARAGAHAAVVASAAPAHAGGSACGARCHGDIGCLLRCSSSAPAAAASAGGGGGSAGGAPRTESPTRESVMAAMNGVRSAVGACHGPLTGMAPVALTFGNDGHVASASVGGSFANTPQGACIARAVRRASVPRFTRPNFTVNFPFAVR